MDDAGIPYLNFFNNQNSILSLEKRSLKNYNYNTIWTIK